MPKKATKKAARRTKETAIAVATPAESRVARVIAARPKTPVRTVRDGYQSLADALESDLAGTLESHFGFRARVAEMQGNAVAAVTNAAG